MRLVYVLFAMWYSVATLSAAPPVVIHSIDGDHLGIILTAIPEAEKRGIQVERYVVKLVDFKDTFVVLFKDPNLPKRHYGSGDLKQLEVKISKATREVLKVNFVR